MDEELVIGALSIKYGYDVVIKPCPFCGSHHVAILTTLRGKFFAECSECHIHSDTFDSKSELIAYWNRWPYDEASEKEDEELAPCPLCGGVAKLEEDCNVGSDPYYVIQCDKCKSNVGDTDRDKLVHIWNERDDERSDALRSCPICGEPAEFWKDDDGWYVRCTVDQYGCGFCTPDFDTKEEAMKLWNGETNE